LERFLSKHGADICLMNGTDLEPDRALSFANYVFHWTDHLIRKGGTAILARRGIDHYDMPILGVQHLETTAVHLVLANRPVKLAAALACCSCTQRTGD
jgi:hypothetical protein